MRSMGSPSLARVRRAWLLGLFVVGGALIVAGVAFVSVPAAMIVAGGLVIGITATEVL